MSSVPDLWRAELWHPMIVHFPITLLLGATVLRWFCHTIGKSRYPACMPASRGMLVAGTLFAWAAIYSGSIADSIVTRTLCDPTILENHEQVSILIGYIFTIAMILDLVHSRWNWADWKGTLGKWAISILLLAGSAGLAYTAHLGASLVYQQGAAVYHPTDGCTEFE